jgi:thiol:disulfide interchange protein DsbD
MTFGGLGVLFVAAGIWVGVALSSKSPINWIYYTPERLAEAKASGDVVVLDFTANWCLNCHALERTQLEQDAVVQLLNSERVRPIKVDITAYEPAQRYLAEVGSTTIPLLIILGPDGQTLFRSDAYRAAQVIAAVQDGLGANTTAAAVAR